jgi:flagellar basal-body rod protein FlgB
MTNQENPLGRIRMIDLGQDTAFAHRVLDAASVRSKVVMHNLANDSTPGFKRYVVEFEDELREALSAGGDAGDVFPRVSRDESGAEGVNNVSEFEEMAVLEKTRALHEIFTKRIGGYFTGMNKAIFGR